MNKQKILIIGGAKRVGANITKHLSKLFDVSITYLSSYDEATNLKKENYVEEIFKLDLSETNSIQEFTSRTLDFDTIIISASCFKPDSQNSPKSWAECMMTNFYAPMQIIDRFKNTAKKIIILADKWALSEPENFYSYYNSRLLTMEHIKDKKNVFYILIGFLEYNDNFPETFFLKHRQSYPSSTEDLLDCLDFLITHDTFSDNIIDLTKWKLTN